MNTPAPERRTIARAAVAAFGGTASVHRYWDDNHESNVDLVACRDSPWAGVTSFATAGVSEVPLMKDGRELRVRAELVGACSSSAEVFSNILATAAFFVVNSGHPAAPGVILTDVFRLYPGSSTSMDHLLLLSPFLWGGRLKTIDGGTFSVAWLLVVPISSSERDYAVQHGVPALEAIFEKEQIDVFDLDRSSVA